MLLPAHRASDAISGKFSYQQAAHCDIVGQLSTNRLYCHALIGDKKMSQVCEICGKHPVAGRSISHSHRVSNRVFRPNVQKITIRDTKGKVRKARVCTSCMKAGKVERA